MMHDFFIGLAPVLFVWVCDTRPQKCSCLERIQDRVREVGDGQVCIACGLGIPAAVTGAGHEAAEERCGGKQGTVTFRLASVHLESLPEGAHALPRH